MSESGSRPVAGRARPARGAPVRPPETADGEVPSGALLVPVKAFAGAKERLAPALDPGERARLARWMATEVVLSAAPVPVTVVCEDADVASWAESLGARVAWKPGTGLNGAVQCAAWELTVTGVARVTVAHADIPDPSGLATVATTGEAAAVLVPDRRRDGTNVLGLPVGALREPGDREGFAFAYGPGSFARHRKEVARLGLACQVVTGTSLAADIDVPGDLELLRPASGTDSVVR